MSDKHVTAPVSYRPIEGFPGYRIGDDGSVWSCRRDKPWRRLKPTTTHGYHYATISNDSETRRVRLHVLVLTVFRGARPSGHVACHNDGCKTNNCLPNLRWDTHKSNEQDKRRHGTDGSGERNPAAKLNAEQVKEIRRRRRMGHLLREISADFNVSVTTVSDIARSRRWGASRDRALADEQVRRSA